MKKYIVGIIIFLLFATVYSQKDTFLTEAYENGEALAGDNVLWETIVAKYPSSYSISRKPSEVTVTKSLPQPDHIFTAVSNSLVLIELKN